MKLVLLLVTSALLAPAASADVVGHECVLTVCAGEFYVGDGCSAGSGYDYGYTGVSAAGGAADTQASLESSCDPQGRSGDSFRLQSRLALVHWSTVKDSQGAQEYGAVGASAATASVLWSDSYCYVYTYPAEPVPCSLGRPPPGPTGGGQLLP